MRQEITSFFRKCASIRASTKTNSIKHSSKCNCLWLHQWTTTQGISPALTGQDFIDGNLENSSIAELTHDFVTWWDDSYPLVEFVSCSKFQDSDIDPVENCQIPKEVFINCHSFKNL